MQVCHITQESLCLHGPHALRPCQCRARARDEAGVYSSANPAPSGPFVARLPHRREEERRESERADHLTPPRLASPFGISCGRTIHPSFKIPIVRRGERGSAPHLIELIYYSVAVSPIATGRRVVRNRLGHRDRLFCLRTSANASGPQVPVSQLAIQRCEDFDY